MTNRRVPVLGAQARLWSPWVLSALQAGLTEKTDPGDLCGPPKSGEHCGPGNDRQTPGGGEKVSHKGWPKVSGIFWRVKDSGKPQEGGRARQRRAARPPRLRPHRGQGWARHPVGRPGTPRTTTSTSATQSWEEPATTSSIRATALRKSKVDPATTTCGPSSDVARSTAGRVTGTAHACTSTAPSVCAGARRSAILRDRRLRARRVPEARREAQPKEVENGLGGTSCATGLGSTNDHQVAWRMVGELARNISEQESPTAHALASNHDQVRTLLLGYINKGWPQDCRRVHGIPLRLRSLSASPLHHARVSRLPW